MIKLLSSLIKLSDFEQTKHHVLFKNDTSSTGVYEPEKVLVTSLDEETINLRVPKKSIGPGHNLTLYIYDSPISEENLKKIKSKNFKSGLEFIGKVKELAEDEDYLYAQVELSQFDQHVWKKICSMYENIQNSVLDLISLQEGDDEL